MPRTFRPHYALTVLGAVISSGVVNAQVLSTEHPGILRNEQAMQVVVSIKTATTLDQIDVAIAPPPGFSTDAQSFTLAKFAGSTLRTVHIKAVTPKPPSGEYTATIRLNHTKGQETISESKTLKFAYQNSDITLRRYLVLGAVGLFLGYWLRIFVKLLSATTPDVPLVAQTASSSDGPLTIFVKTHYYAIDCLVTLLLGVGVLIGLANADGPPSIGSRTHTALLVGMSIGLLTNSELITKLTSRLPARI